MAQAKRRSFSDRQGHVPVSVKLWPQQRRDIDAAAKALGVTRSRLLRSAALTVAAELQNGAQPSLRLHR